jgi:hypothetical protein
MTARETMASRGARPRTYQFWLNGAGPFERNTPLNPKIMARVLIERAKKIGRYGRLIEAMENKIKQRLKR